MYFSLAGSSYFVFCSLLSSDSNKLFYYWCLHVHVINFIIIIIIIIIIYQWNSYFQLNIPLNIQLFTRLYSMQMTWFVE